VHLGILALGWLSAAALIGLWADLIKHPTLRKSLWLVGNFVLCALLIEAASWSLIRNQILRMSLPEMRTFAWLTNTPMSAEHLTGDGMGGTGTKNTYSPHPFLNYALNPDSKYMGISQFNSHYLIRRTEPIRERSKVAWRALVLGGSTTFNEGIRREEGTWVYQLERQLRDRFGDGYDVINGGVGGYSILDNLLHYSILLRELKPDLVILFAGINDVTPRLIGNTAFDYSNSRTPWNGDDIKWLEVVGPLGRLNVVRLYILMQIKKGGLGHIFSAVQRPYPPVSEWEDALRRNKPDIYATHLQFVISTLRSQNQSVLVLPQLWHTREQNESDRIFAIGVSENNQINELTAREMSVPYMESLLFEQFLSSDFLDNCHFTVSGNERMARTLSNYLVAAQLFR
jgi:lysophospholipase L1-like esterase